ncbi:Helicase C-terminal [Penicillium chermesinum]|uniref:Helicase C-terminal n=1 Tax=Penicillium chermesinum TaxID=63820 RepID=A0A9W9PJ00_9EURO|nr:Helicase C-terminal [Penicillium chermesinum]KAJ5247698.1 Helicase C-terminal [Penicillium chermesinum]
MASHDSEESRLQALNVTVRNQDDLERDITRKADQLLAEKAEENETKRLEKALVEREKVINQIRNTENQLAHHAPAAAQRRLRGELDRLKNRRIELAKDVRDIQNRIDGKRQAQQDVSSSHGPGRLPNESRRDYLLRTGKITPFELATAGDPTGAEAPLRDALVDVEDEQMEKEERDRARHDAPHRNLARPTFGFDEESEDSGAESGAKRRKITESSTHTKKGKSARTRTSSSPSASSEASYVASEDGVPSSEEEYMPDVIPEIESTASKRKRGKMPKTNAQLEDLGAVDDGDESVYQERLESWVNGRSSARRREQPDYVDHEDDEEWHKPHPKWPSMELPNGLSIPGDIAHFLFPYQRTGVQWLWELHQQSVGGIIGDEMGLGKTVQAIAYLASLHHSKMLDKPVIVVCPATLMVQWVTEFHNWWPSLRVSILHSSGSGMLNLKKESSREDQLTSEMMSGRTPRFTSAGQKAAKQIIKRVVEGGHVLVTTYSGLQSYSDALVDVEWGCAILDEGHKIRNPDAAITFSCKELRTPHRIILSGTPIQNSLVDLWSLFDFVFPMRLGNLITFKTQFEIPIRQGGYAAASNLQVQTAARCAETLKDAIKPYLLQRFKADVAADLPQKSEQVIFCQLTQWQRTIYKRFLSSDDMKSIFKGTRKSFSGIDMLRKICNHPDLADREIRSREEGYGDPNRSGKMQVLKGLLEVWKDTGHKTLLFAQTVQMLDILEKFVESLGGFSWRRMDGATPINKRQRLVNEFNSDPDIHVFLLTTKVGGIGVNLTGADRVVIYDPDWNPSTDMQARERAWRLGQTRDVTIFRLMMKGTIEEKIYHRQIFKQFLTNKITKDPHQRESFHLSDLYDLFSLTDENDKELETTKLFADAEVTYEADQGHQSEDLNKVQGVAKVEDFRTDEANGGGESSGSDGHGAAKPSEDRLMHSIFSRSGVHAAVEHDRIINGKRVVRADQKMIEDAARRVANEAAEELRRAEETARSLPIGIPTWTGQFGVGGRGAPAGSTFKLFERDSRSHARGKEFVPLIREFFLSRRQPVPTQVIIDHFNHYCGKKERADEFQRFLKEIAELKRDRRGRGVWTLRPEAGGKKESSAKKSA